MKRKPLLVEVVDEFVEFDESAVTDPAQLAPLKAPKGRSTRQATAGGSPGDAASRAKGSHKTGRSRPKRGG